MELAAVTLDQAPERVFVTRSSGLEQFALEQDHRLRLLWARSPVLYNGHEAT
jgi:hypothetical protein